MQLTERHLPLVPRKQSPSLQSGDQVRLISKPDGVLSQHYPLTLGAIYEVQDCIGSNVVTTTDVPGETADYWRGRVEKI